MKSLEERLEEYIDNLGLRYFKGKEFTPYWSRKRKNGSNSVPPRHLWPNIVKTLIVLDEIRHRAGHPIQLTSTYRSPEYNRAVSGAANSHHMRFNAIDFQSRKVSAWRLGEIARSLRNKSFKNPITGEKFTFKGGIEEYNTFVHVDTRGTNVDW